MSDRASRWAREMTVTPTGARLTGPEAQLLLFIATHHSEIDGASRWPTIDEQRAFMRLQERRVQWLNAQLEQKGCFRRDHRGGRGNPTTYELLMPGKGAVSDIAEEKGRTPDGTLYMEDSEKGAVKGAVSDSKRVQSAVPDGGDIGGETLRVTGSTPSSSPSFPTVTSETTTAAAPKKAKKSERTPDPRTAVIFHQLEDLQGYKFDRASSPRTMRAIREMLDANVTPDEILGCWKTLKGQDFWSRNFLELSFVAKSMGEYRKGTLGRGTSPPRNGTGPPVAKATNRLAAIMTYEDEGDP